MSKGLASRRNLGRLQLRRRPPRLLRQLVAHKRQRLAPRKRLKRYRPNLRARRYRRLLAPVPFQVAIGLLRQSTQQQDTQTADLDPKRLSPLPLVATPRLRQIRFLYNLEMARNIARPALKSVKHEVRLGPRPRQDLLFLSFDGSFFLLSDEI